MVILHLNSEAYYAGGVGCAFAYIYSTIFLHICVHSCPLFMQLHSVLKGFNKHLTSQDVSFAGVTGIQHTFIEESSVPELISNVVLPAVLDSAASLVRSGLCVIIRHVIKVAHSAAPGQGLTDLLVCGVAFALLTFVSVSSLF